MHDADLTTSAPESAGPLSHVPPELYGAHAVGRHSTDLAPRHPELPPGRHRPGIPGHIARVKAAKILGRTR